MVVASRDQDPTVRQQSGGLILESLRHRPGRAERPGLRVVQLGRGQVINTVDAPSNEDAAILQQGCRVTFAGLNQ